MSSFQYARPTSLDQAVELLTQNQDRALILGGGTDLLSSIKGGLASPQMLIDLKGIDALSGIQSQARGLRIGSLTTMSQLLDDDNVASSYPALIQAAEGITSPQIRNRGTLGGDLCQRPRCWYYRNGFGLLAQKDGRSMVRDGDNRYHAILGNGGAALFVNPSSLAPPLLAYGATLRIAGASGEREVKLSEFFRTPQREGEMENVLASDDIVIGVDLPAQGNQSATYEVRQKEALDWPLAAASVALEMSAGRVREAKIVLGHVAPVPWESQAGSDALSGRSISEESAGQAAEAALSGAAPLSRNGYKVRLAKTAVKRAILRATGEEV